MANWEHLRILEQGVEAWNKWRTDNKWSRPNLAEADLREADLMQADLWDADFTEANLEGATLVGGYFGGARFDGAALTGANLSGAELAGAHGLTQEQLNTACADATTTLPAGMTAPRC